MRNPSSIRSSTLCLIAGMLVWAACASDPVPIVHGEDACAYCKMTATDDRYGAELITQKGKVIKFDAIECMARYELEGQVQTDDIQSRWVVDFRNPPHLIGVTEAFFLHSRDLRSPMGMNLTAFGPQIERQAVSHAFYGDILEWDGVMQLVKDHQPAPTGIDSMVSRPSSMPLPTP